MLLKICSQNPIEKRDHEFVRKEEATLQGLDGEKGIVEMIQLYHNLNIEVYQNIFLNMKNFIEIDFNQTWNRNTDKDENQFIMNRINELENSLQIRSIKTKKELKW